MVFTKFAPVLAVAAALAASDASAMPRVDSAVHRALRQQGTVNLIVTMKSGVDNAINAVKEADYATRGQKIAALVTSLETNAKTAQQSVDAILGQEASGLFTSQESFWITNQKAIKGATIELVEKLAAVPEIAEIREELVIPTPKFTVASNTTTKATILANEWGVTKIAAPSVWAAGYTGQNIVIGSLDTGARATHTSIAANYRSSYNWFDATPAKKTVAYDDLGHGTHTIGTMVGSNGLGVAPGAKFIACKAFTADGGEESALLSCAQFLTCPTTATGTAKDCTKAPNVVNNSWGGGQGDTFFAAAIKAWRAANIIPLFANGNEGPACKTASSPGDSADVITVGATDSTDGLASFSSKGPTVGGLVKPEVSGPGVNVRSAWYNSNTAFNTISGTSMATPHVAGVVALLLSKNPNLTFAQIKTALTSTTDKSTLKSSGYTCGGTKDTTYPNNQYGWGRINALSAYKTV